MKNKSNRRNFLKKVGLLSTPLMIPGMGLAHRTSGQNQEEAVSIDQPQINFIWDGFFFTPDWYIQKLAEINQANSIEADYYGNGGPTEKLETEFARITGKEKAIYLPTGTMANQLAMKLLNGIKTKVIVPENSHIFRDEADAAAAVHELRLIPIGKDKAYYDLEDLKTAIEYDKKGFYYDSGLGTVVIENPVRRALNKFVPIENIREISAFCREKGLKLHLDGARLHIAAAFSGVSVEEYASYFDTVYISLYKYLNAGGGAILCGDSDIIEKMEHQIKILGGSILRNWTSTAMALHYLAEVDQRWAQVVERSQKLIQELNKMGGLKIWALENGSNSHRMTLSDQIDPEALSEQLYLRNILWSPARKDEESFFFVVNDTMLLRSHGAIINAWSESIVLAKG